MYLPSVSCPSVLTNSLFASLNARQNLRKIQNTTTQNTTTLCVPSFQNGKPCLPANNLDSFLEVPARGDRDLGHGRFLSGMGVSKAASDVDIELGLVQARTNMGVSADSESNVAIREMSSEGSKAVETVKG